MNNAHWMFLFQAQDYTVVVFMICPNAYHLNGMLAAANSGVNLLFLFADGHSQICEQWFLSAA